MGTHEVASASAPTVLLVEDYEAFARLLRRAFASDGRFRVIGSVSDAASAIDMAAAHRPAVVVLDDVLPGMSGLDALPAIREVSPRSLVVMYSATLSTSSADEALELGAVAVVSKLDPIRVLLEVIGDSLALG